MRCGYWGEGYLIRGKEKRGSEGIYLSLILAFSFILAILVSRSGKVVNFLINVKTGIAILKARNQPFNEGIPFHMHYLGLPKALDRGSNHFTYWPNLKTSKLS